MKRLLLKSRMALGVLVASSFAVSAQDISDYEHIVSTSPYSSLSGTADVLVTGDEGTPFDEETYLVSLPFDFSYNGTVYNSIYVNVNGYIAFGGDCAIATPILDGVFGDEDGIVAACNVDLLGPSTDATIRTTVTGTAPFRTFIIEWANMYEQINYLSYILDSDAISSLNFQIVLHEGDGVAEAQKIDIHYGEMTVTEDINVSVGLRYDGDVNLLTSATDWASLTATTDNLDQVSITSTIAPVSGTMITFTTDVALPVLLQQISATNQGQQNIINWTSAKEAEGDLYILERSTDGRNFDKLDQLWAKGTPSQYRYTDLAPFDGINYYRIRVLNNDHTGFFSKVVSATLATPGEVTLAPNPANDYIAIGGLKKYLGGSLMVINSLGQQVYAGSIKDSNISLEVSGFAAGIYHVCIQSGTLTKTVKFVRQ